HPPNAETAPATGIRTAAQRPPPLEWRVSSDNSTQAAFPSTLSKTSTADGDGHPCPTAMCYELFSLTTTNDKPPAHRTVSSKIAPRLEVPSQSQQERIGHQQREQTVNNTQRNGAGPGQKPQQIERQHAKGDWQMRAKPLRCMLIRMAAVCLIQ